MEPRLTECLLKDNSLISSAGFLPALTWETLTSSLLTVLLWSYKLIPQFLTSWMKHRASLSELLVKCCDLGL